MLQADFLLWMNRPAVGIKETPERLQTPEIRAISVLKKLCWGPQPLEVTSAQRSFWVTYVTYQLCFFLSNESLFFQTFIPQILEDLELNLVRFNILILCTSHFSLLSPLYFCSLYLSFSLFILALFLLFTISILDFTVYILSFLYPFPYLGLIFICNLCLIF